MGGDREGLGRQVGLTSEATALRASARHAPGRATNAAVSVMEIQCTPMPWRECSNSTVAVRRLLRKLQPRLREREPEGLVLGVVHGLRHAQAALRIAAVFVADSHV